MHSLPPSTDWFLSRRVSGIIASKPIHKRKPLSAAETKAPFVAASQF